VYLILYGAWVLYWSHIRNFEMVAGALKRKAYLWLIHMTERRAADAAGVTSGLAMLAWRR